MQYLSQKAGHCYKISGACRYKAGPYVEPQRSYAAATRGQNAQVHDVQARLSFVPGAMPSNIAHSSAEGVLLEIWGAHPKNNAIAPNVGLNGSALLAKDLWRSPQGGPGHLSCCALRHLHSHSHICVFNTSSLVQGQARQSPAPLNGQYPGAAAHVHAYMTQGL